MSKASKKNPQKREKGGKISRIASKREERGDQKPCAKPDLGGRH